MPRLPPFATEQRVLSAKELQAFQETIQSVLEWLDHIAKSLLKHRKTPEYAEAVRKSGVAHGQSGLSATEQDTKAAIDKANKDFWTAKDLDKQWSKRTLTWNRCQPWQKKLLNAYWDGSLKLKRFEATSGGSRDTMCRMPSVATGSATEQIDDS